VSKEAWQPYVHRRSIVWGDTDTAHIVYTGRFLDFLLEAIEAFMCARVGCDWYRLNVEEKMGTPFVNVGLDFKSSVTPREGLDTRILVAQVGKSSVRVAARGTGAESGTLRFTGTATFVFITATDCAPLFIPQPYRAALEAEAAEAAALLSSESA